MPDLFNTTTLADAMPIIVLAAILVAGLVIFAFKTAAARNRLAVSEAAGRLELARLEERALRLVDADSQLSQMKERHAGLTADLARTRATLDERDNETRRLKQELEAARTELADTKGKHEEDEADLREALGAVQSKLSAVNADLRAKTEEAESLKADLLKAREQREEAQRLLSEASKALAEVRSRAEAERKSADEKLALLQEARTQLSDQFKALAADILEEKSKSFSEANRASLGTLIDPLKVQLADFKGKVEEVYINEAKERSALGEQVRQLFNLNQQLSRDAHNLTSALRGQNKSQGNWGELILERVLEAAGLVKGLHFTPQESHARDDGSRIQPDVVLNLPGQRFMVIDSKVSLNAYELFSTAEEDGAREAALRRHLDSIRSHIKDLSAKNYQEIHGLSALDFVILFVPIEPAFLVAITRDAELWHQAWEKNILLVSPSSLLFVVRIVAQLWQKEQQSKNAQDIAKRGAELYDKFVGFVEDLEKVGKGLKDAQGAYDRAYGKFATGRGNVIRQAEMLRTLGLKTTKRLDANLLDAADSDEDTGALPAPEDQLS
ncbi:DNA recombination protein RmuC [Pleomorphomonas diazotrophica]|nr:DNA recombination protein RmuC [Pleomorphomonas diazotrophica]SFM91930.1 DNA recombination protein RmuC [Pleomorphomonas diazotrophica]